MASFVPYYSKKRLRLKEREGELLSLLQKGASEEAILRAALEVRDARVQALREKMAKLPASEKSAPAMDALRTEMDIANAASVPAIVEDFRTRASHLKEPMSIFRAPRRRGH